MSDLILSISPDCSCPFYFSSYHNKYDNYLSCFNRFSHQPDSKGSLFCQKVPEKPGKSLFLNEKSHCFNMNTVSEHICTSHFLYFIPIFFEELQIPGQCGRITAHINNAVWRHLCHTLEKFFITALSWRVHYDNIRMGAGSRMFCGIPVIIFREHLFRFSTKKLRILQCDSGGHFLWHLQSPEAQSPRHRPFGMLCKNRKWFRFRKYKSQTVFPLSIRHTPTLSRNFCVCTGFYLKKMKGEKSDR